MKEKEQNLINGFVEWLPDNITQFSGIIPDNVIKRISNAKNNKGKTDINKVTEILNSLDTSEQGKQIITVLFKSYQEQNMNQNSELFKEGGKLTQLVNKLQRGSIIIRQQQPKGLRGLFWQPKFQPRDDGKRGGVATYIKPNGTEITQVIGPYTTYTQTAKPNGTVIMEEDTKNDSNRYVSRKWKNRNNLRPDLVDMFNDIYDRTKNPPIVLEK